jgi:hypothetical protein
MVELILKINKYCYLLHLVGLDFITLPTIKLYTELYGAYDSEKFATLVLRIKKGLGRKHKTFYNCVLK